MRWKRTIGHLFKKGQHINDEIHKLQILEESMEGLSESQRAHLLALQRNYHKILPMQEIL